MYRQFVNTSIGFPSNIAMSASFPASMLPTRASTLHISAALIVMAFKPSEIPRPSLAARPAQKGDLVRKVCQVMPATLYRPHRAEYKNLILIDKCYNMNYNDVASNDAVRFSIVLS